MGKRVALNKHAVMLVKEMVSIQDALNIKFHHYADGITIIDGGVEFFGGYEAGAYFSEIILGGLGNVSFCEKNIGEFQIPSIQVRVDHPLEACMLSQYAGWNIVVGDYKASASGPGRILADKEEIFKEYSFYYEGRNAPAVIFVDSSELPEEETADFIVEEMATPCSDSYILAAPPESLVGSIQNSARVVEKGILKMYKHGFEIEKIEAAWGTCPIAPTAADRKMGLARSRDAVIYGGTAYYQLSCDDSEIEEIINKIPSSYSKDYGDKFVDILNKDQSGMETDPMLLSPAKVIINNRKSGKIFKAGNIDEEILKKSFFIDM